MTEERNHDASYKRVMSNPIIVQQLIEGFLPRELLEELDLDFSQMTKHETSFHLESLNKREGDLIWRISRRHGAPLYVFVMIELQSSVDQDMAMRVLLYVSLLYEQLARLRPRLQERGEPRPWVLPIVFYNGSTPWSAARSMHEYLGVQAGMHIVRFLPQICYYLIDEQRLNQSLLESMNSVLATLIQFESAQPAQLPALIEQLLAQLQAEAFAPLRRDLVAWIGELFRAQGILFDDQHIDTLLENKVMLEERLKQWRQQDREEGREEGLEQGLERGREEGVLLGQRAVLNKQLTLKFGDDATRGERLQSLNAEALERALALILTAQSEDELFAALLIP